MLFLNKRASPSNTPLRIFNINFLKQLGPGELALFGRFYASSGRQLTDASNTHCLLNKPNLNSRSVNLALETVLEFNGKDKQADIKLLDNIQQVISEIRTVIDKNNNVSNVKSFRRSSRDDTLTDFIQEAVIIVNSYGDTAFDDFINILNKEISNYNYRGCKFYELMKNNEIGKLISVKFDSIKDKPTRFKKAAFISLSDVLSYKNNDNNVKELVDYINSLYRKAGGKFQKVLSDLEGYGKMKTRKSKTDLVKIIKNGLRSIIFDHYSNLSMNERRLLKRKIETLWKRYRNSLPSRDRESNIANMKPNNIMNKAKNVEPDPAKYKIYATSKKTKLNKIKTKQYKHENEVSEDNEIKNAKKRYKHTKKDTINKPRDIQEKKTKQTIQDDLDVKEHSDIKNKTELDSHSSSLESIEPNHTTSGQNTFKLTKATKKPDIIENLNMATSIAVNNPPQKKLIFIEESTGRLPQAVIDKLANKSRGHTSNHNLGSQLNDNGPKYKRNKVHSNRRGTVNRLELIKTRRKGYGVGYDKVYGKKYYLKNQRVKNRYSDTKYAHENMLEPEYENINEQYNKNAYESNYESQYAKTTEKVHATENEKPHEKIYESDYHKMRDKPFELENERTHGKVYDGQHKKPHRGFQEKRKKLNRKVLKKHQYNKMKRRGMNKLKNLLTRSTTKQFFQMLDVQMPKETGKVIKSMARRTVASSKLPGPARNKQAQENERVIVKPTGQTLPQPAFVNNLERPLVKVNHEASSNTEEVGKVKHRFEVKSNIVKPKEIVTMSALGENKNVKDYSSRLDTEESVGNKTEFIEFEDLEDLKTPEAKLTSEYAKEFHSNNASKQDKANMAGAIYKNKELFINYVTDRDSKINKYDKDREITTEIKFRPENTIDYKVRQNKFKTTRVSVDTKDFPVKEHEDSKINLSETGFRSGVKLNSIANNVKPDDINKTKTSVNNTDLLIQRIADKDSKNKENVTKTDIKSKNIFIPVTDTILNDNQVGQNETKKKETANNKINFIAGIATDVDSIKNNTESKKYETILRTDVNRDFQVTQNDLKVPGAADNEIEPINDNNNVKDIDFTINDLGNVFEKTNKFEARSHKSDLQSMLDNIQDTIKESNLIETPDVLSEFQQTQDKNYNSNMKNYGVFLRSDTNNLNDKTDQIVTGTVHNIINVNDKESKSRKEIVDNYHKVYQVNGKTTMNGETPKEIKSTKQQDLVKKDINIIKINTVTLGAKYKRMTAMTDKTDQNLINNYVDVATKDTKIIDRNSYSTVTPIKSIESTTTIVNTSAAVTGPTTLTVTVPVSIPVVTSSKIPGTWIPGVLPR